MTHSEQRLHELVAAELDNCRKHFEADSFEEALLSVQKAKSCDPQNIYILALEKQVKLLAIIGKSKPVTPSQKSEIIRTMPEIARRAVENARTRESKPKQSEAPPPPSPEKSGENAARQAALKKRTDQFIKLAGESVAKGDYKKAREELHRVFMIDADNAEGRELEAKIESLLQAETASAAEPEPDISEDIEMPAVEEPVEAVLEASDSDDSFDSQAQAVESKEEPADAPMQTAPEKIAHMHDDKPAARRVPKKKGKFTSLAVAAIIVMIIAGVAVVYFVPSLTNGDTAIAGGGSDGRTRIASDFTPQTQDEMNGTASAVDGEAQPQNGTRSEAERREAERREAERRQAEQREAERAEAERLAAEREEAERREAEQREAERLAAEQRQAERLAAERAEAERQAAERAAAERLLASAEPERVETQRQVFEVVEEMPEIIGGMSAIVQHLEYPRGAIRAGIEGTVFVMAYVDSDGVVRETDVVTGIGGGCDEAAANAVSKVRFRPGRQRGEAVDVRVMVPVRFSLQDERNRRR
jgi:TonB family protein